MPQAPSPAAAVRCPLPMHPPPPPAAACTRYGTALLQQLKSPADA